MPDRTIRKLRRLTDFAALVDYLRDELDWPIEVEDAEDLVFDYDPAELGLDPQHAAKIETLKQVRPLVDDQPWGIFYLEFETKHLPVVVLRRILHALIPRSRARRADQPVWQLEDLLFVATFGEAAFSQREIAFAHFHQEAGALPTLRVLGWDGADTPLKLEHVAATLQAQLRWPADPDDADAWREQWTRAFRHRLGHIIRTADALADRLALLARSIRDAATTLMAHEAERGPLRRLHKAFQTALIHDLSEADFADTYAQTVAYGLLTAAIQRTPPDGGRYDTTLYPDMLAEVIPITNPFLREMLQTFLQVGGRQGDRNSGIDFDELGIQDVVDLLNSGETDLPAILRDFNNRGRGEDPVIHFYEHFLSAYNKQLKVQRGVFYTPQPAVSYIVRSVHALLQTEFGLEDGLASTVTWGEMAKRQEAGGRRQEVSIEHRASSIEFRIPAGVDPDSAFVVVLDPATGTATFLVEVIDVIYQTLTAKWTAQGLTKAQQRAAWNEYVPNHLLPRLYGYELMMAPYAIAHMKIGLKLTETHYDFHSDARVRVYLTNALEPATDDEQQLRFAELVPALAHEARAVNEVKRLQRFTVVVGNPPYSGHSANDSTWVAGLLRGVDGAGRTVENYFEVDGHGLDERNPKWLNDDYVKFIRFGQWRIADTGVGILAFITNHGYLDNPTFRGMRQSLMADFNRIGVFDLHGSSKKKETTPEGGPDENVFDIMPGVAILLAAKAQALAPRVDHADLYGLRGQKYAAFTKQDVTHTAWTPLEPASPFYLFAPQDVALRGEYMEGWKVTDALPVNVLGFQTHRDDFAIAFDKADIEERIALMRSKQLSDAEFRARFDVNDNPGWKLDRARRELRTDVDWKKAIIHCSYRPFDDRWCYFSTVAMDRPRRELLDHVAWQENLCLNVVRQTKMQDWQHALVSRSPTPALFVEIKDGSSIFPLYLYPTANVTLFDSQVAADIPGGRRPNLAPDFIKALETQLGMRFQPHPPAPSPKIGEGEQEGEQEGERERGVRQAPPRLWAKLKPLARQMRHEPTPAENALWQQLRNRKVAGVKFRRQHAIERFIVDFYAAKPGLVIEVDGPIHDYTQEEDAVRQAYLESQGLRVLRFTNDQVLYNLNHVLTTISAILPTPPLQSLERGPGGEVFTPEDIFHYAYAIFHSPTYRTRYAEFLKIDFPRLPLTSDVSLFRALAALGADLVALHLLEDDYPAASWNPPQSPHPWGEAGSPLQHPITTFVEGANGATMGAFSKSACYENGPDHSGRVYLDTSNRARSSYFDGVPEDVWNFHVGGYQVLYKWLYDRRGSGGDPGRTLTPEDIAHYQRIVVALKETMRLMTEIDAVIEDHGGWPIG